ncbi:hypothetical protein KAR91_56180 [Candidatus Pacearchaeota archaeon]|nr:hypothetical protein [Candidatus Pacearchaeota archaeon]
MELTVNRKELAAAVKSAVSIIETADRTNFTVPKICLSARKGSLTVSLSRYTEKFKEIIKPEIKTPGTIFLDADRFNSIMGGVVSESIEIIEDSGNNTLIVRTDNSETAIPLSVAVNHPGHRFKKLPHRFKLEKKDFRDIYDRCLFAIGENDSRKNLMGMNIKKVGDEIVFMAADAYRIVEYRLKASNTIVDEIILPKAALKKINILFGKSEKLSFWFDQENLIVSADNRTFQTKLIQADYPNLNAILVSPKGDRIKLDVESMVRATRLLKRSADSDPHMVLKLILGNQNIRLENQQISAYPVSWSNISCDYKGKSVEIGLNINFLNQALMKLKKKGEIEIVISDSVEPVFFLDPENTRFKSIQMPVKIKW